jgi:NADH-quinone oxidoreductase subunit N
MEALKTIRPELLSLSQEQFQVLMPYISVFAGAILAILGSVLRVVSPKWPVFLISIATCLVGIYFSYDLLDHTSLILFNGMMVSDPYSNFFNIVFLSSALVTILASFRYLDKELLQHPEFYVLLIFAALGMMLMASSLDLVVLFIALELMSLSVYILVGFRRADRRSNEAAMKYFILGSTASAVLLYGAALLYGTTGSIGIKTIFSFAQSHPESMSPVFVLGAAMVLFGFLFKVAAAPFHMWMPDVYEGAPVPITGFMTTGLKAAAFATFIRVFIEMGYGKGLAPLFHEHIHNIMWVSAVLTMVIGNFIALSQTNLKRMLAYSSIAHTGYLLVGIVSGAQSELGYAPAVLYIVVYAIMNMGAFVVLTLLASRDEGGLNLHDLSGLSRRQPWLAFALAIFFFSMAGIPPTGGFAAKYLLFYSAVQAHEISLVIISVLCSAVSVYFYLRVLVYIYLRDPVGSPPVLRVSLGSGIAVVMMVILTLQIGILPAKIFNVAKKVSTGLQPV